MTTPPTPSDEVRPLDWLILVLPSWFGPLLTLQVFQPKLAYFASLLFWLLPIGLLTRRFFVASSMDARSGLPYSRRRRALLLTIAYVLAAGVFLDFGLGKWVLDFEGGSYLKTLWGVPIEECLFYALAPIAIVLVYAWSDETWLSRYNTRDLKLELGRADTLVRPSPALLAAGALLFAAGAGLKWVWSAGESGWLPVYYTFLLAAALLPAAMLYRALRDHVNWPAFAFTTVFVVGTSLIWEVTLALPEAWWGYRPEAMIGPAIAAWKGSKSMFPIEAAIVWFCAPFSCVLTYEAVKYFQYQPQATVREKLWTGEAPQIPTR